MKGLMAENEIETKWELQSGNESVFICLKCFCLTFNLWKCMEHRKYNCKVDFDHRNLSSACSRRPCSNHCGFTPLMMGRELIYPGEKQIKALLSPALCHTMAYINI